MPKQMDQEKSVMLVNVSLGLLWKTVWIIIKQKNDDKHIILFDINQMKEVSKYVHSHPTPKIH